MMAPSKGSGATSPWDDEGRPGARNVLIENGVLTDYMWDYLRSRKEGRLSSGNGRRQSYQHLPMVRMTNTYLLAGESDADEIVAQTPYGVYVAQLGGGQVNTATGDFVFGMDRGVHDRGRQDHVATARLQPHRQRSRRSPACRRGRHRLLNDARHVRQERSERAGGLRAGNHAPDRCHHWRGGGVSDLIERAVRILESVKGAEEIEVYLASGVDTEVQSYQGEIEELTNATSTGIGIRVLRDGASGAQVGTAWAGSLDDAAVRDALG